MPVPRWWSGFLGNSIRADSFEVQYTGTSTMIRIKSTGRSFVRFGNYYRPALNQSARRVPGAEIVVAPPLLVIENPPEYAVPYAGH